MKIVHISASDSRGGAARAAYGLHRALRGRGADSIFITEAKGTRDPSVVPFFPDPAPWRRVGRAWRRETIRIAMKRYADTRPSGFEAFHGDRSQFGPELRNRLPFCDILHLHWVAEFLDWKNFFRSDPPEVPVIWTLHDMNAFSGGCHFDAGCGRHTDSCGLCPQLGSSRLNDLSREVWKRKKRALGMMLSDRLFFVAPSDWLARQARLSSLLKDYSTTVIPYGIDTEIFRPILDARFARRGFGIPDSAPVLLFVADYADNQRKGFYWLTRALGQLRCRERPFLLSLGNGRMETSVDLPHLHLGPVANDRLLSVIYNLADIFVVPSLQDNFPNTVLEAMACGLPVAGFAAGGIPEMVAHGKSGLIVPVRDAAGLAAALDELVDSPKTRESFGSEGRRIAVERFPLHLQATRYGQLYRALADLPASQARHAASNWMKAGSSASVPFQ